MDMVFLTKNNFGIIPPLVDEWIGYFSIFVLFQKSKFYSEAVPLV